MATTIKLKSSSTASAVPSLNNLSLRELAINTADGKLYVRKGNGSASDTIIDIGGNSVVDATNDALALAIALG
tara:strand:- start:1582 stop:1800 length:219 start_codon:yes stop_codon:yes gene_type:complete